MTSLTYSPLQERAIDAIVEWYNNPFQQEFFLAGFAGVGKTTVCAEAVRRIKDKYKISNVPTVAYTGKAAHVLRKKGNLSACTIHSLIYAPVEDPITHEVTFVRQEFGGAAGAELIIADEVSMVDVQIAEDLRKYKKKILVMGDLGQLPPVNGEGAFTNREPDFFLNEIHRQSLDSPIIELSVMAREGKPLPIGYNKDGVQVLRLTNTTQEHLFNPDAQVICGINRIRWAVTQLIRERLGFTSHEPQPTERIMMCKNNKEAGVFNGAMGKLRKLEVTPAGAYKITADIEGNFYKNLVTDPFLFKQHFDSGASKVNHTAKYKNWADFSYAITTHKAQGSGFPNVVLIDNSSSFREDAAKMLYTGITRAESGLIVLVP